MRRAPVVAGKNIKNVAEDSTLTEVDLKTIDFDQNQERHFHIVSGDKISQPPLYKHKTK